MPAPGKESSRELANGERPTATGLLTDAAVDPLPQEVGMAIVAGVLLDHVDQELSQRDRSAGAVTPQRS